ncbi:hypothetical protein D3C71_2057420 [compost metagenome]
MLLLARLAVGDARLCVLGARLGDENANADTWGVLLLQQIGQVFLSRFGDDDVAHGDSSQIWAQCTPCRGADKVPAF